MTLMYVSMNYIITDSDNVLTHARRQTITWTSTGLLSIWLMGINCCEIQIEIQKNMLKNIVCNMATNVVTVLNLSDGFISPVLFINSPQRVTSKADCFLMWFPHLPDSFEAAFLLWHHTRADPSGKISKIKRRKLEKYHIKLIMIQQRI